MLQPRPQICENPCLSVNGIKLQGQIESFDQFVILLKNTVSQMVYKHAISTVVPSRPVRLPASEQAGEADDV